MANINLYEGLGNEKKGKGPRIIENSLFVSLGIFILVAGGFGGLKIYSKNLTSKIESTNAAINEELSTLGGGDAQRVADFELRLDEISKTVDLKKEDVNYFEIIEKSIIEGAVLDSFDFSKDNQGKTVELKMKTNNFETIAKQLLILKESDFINNVEISNISNMEDGIYFQIKAIISK